MPANITELEGQSTFAANVSRGHPWHRLGVEVSADMDIEGALEVVGVRHETVRPATMYTYEDGKYEEVEDRIAIRSNVFGNISTAGVGYEIMQRREIVELAYDMVGLAKGEAAIDTVGNLGPKGQVFFAYLRVPDLVIDSGGIGDVIERGLFVATSFDGTLPNTIGYSAIRVVCQNTLNVAFDNLGQALKFKHTRNSEERMFKAAEGLGYVGAVEREMVKRAEDMLRVDGDRAMRKVLDSLWPVDREIGDMAKERRQMDRGAVYALYEGEKNVGSVGRNGWAAYNAATEFIDHNRSVRGIDGKERRAVNAVLPGKWQDMKVKASKAVLELV